MARDDADQRSQGGEDDDAAAGVPESDEAAAKRSSSTAGSGDPVGSDDRRAGEDGTDPVSPGSAIESSSAPEEDEDEDDRGGPPRKELILSDRELQVAEFVSEQVTDHIEAALHLSSGPIPDPDVLARYPEPVQERILRMAEAATTDESARRTRITDAQIKNAAVSLWISLGIVVAFGGAALYAFAFIGRWAGFGLLAVPLLRFAGQIVSATSLRRQRKDS